MRKLITTTLFSAMAIWVNAGNDMGLTRVDKGGESVTTDSAKAIKELPLPSVPAALKTPSERAGYIINHFWDAMDFNDARLSHDTLFIEQNLANFISVLPYATEDSRREAIDNLLMRAEIDPEAYKLLISTAETYLYDTDSPMFEEEFYMLFVENSVKSPLWNEYEAQRLRFQLEATRKNRPGSRATDFVYETRDGDYVALSSTNTEGPLLLIFYDPSCEHCTEIMTTLRENEALTAASDDGRLNVLAVYAGEDKELWTNTAKSLPTRWIVGFDKSDIEEKELYALRTMPTLYLLDKDKRVVLKNARLETLLAWLEANL